MYKLSTRGKEKILFAARYFIKILISSFLQIQRGWQRFKFGWRYVEIHRNEAGKEKVSIYGPESKEWIQFVKFVGPPPQE